MSNQQIKLNKLEMNIKLPQELHLIRIGQKEKSKVSQYEIPAIIEDSEEKQEGQKNTQRIRRIESIDDKAEFKDQKGQIRISQKDELNESINRIKNSENEQLIEEQILQKIIEQGNNEQTNFRQLKHISIKKDEDEFNLKSNEKKQTKKKRRLSQSNIQKNSEIKKSLLSEYFSPSRKRISHPIENIMEEENEADKKQKKFGSPLLRKRIHSAHSIHRGSSPGDDFLKMIVDELDKKKKSTLKLEQTRDAIPEFIMEQIVEEKQEEENPNIFELEEGRLKIQEQISNLSKVVGHQIGPEINHTLILKVQTPILEEDVNADKDE